MVLLIAVMFTFSFGSAFAAVNYNTATFNYDQAVAELQQVAADKIAAVTKAAAYGGDSPKYAAKAEAEAVAQYVAKYTAAIQKELDEQLTLLYTESITDEDGAYTIATKVSAIQNVSLTWDTAAWNLAASIEEVELYKAEYKAVIEAIDLSVYSKEVAAGETLSNYDKAAKLVSMALTSIDAQKADEKSVSANDGTAIELHKIYKAAVGLGDPSGALYDGQTKVFDVEYKTTNADGTVWYGLKGIPTVAAETVDAAKVDYAKAYVMKEMKDAIAARKAAFVEPLQAYNFAVALKTNPTKAELKKVEENKEAIAKADADFAKIEEVVVYLVNDATKLGVLGTVDANGKVSYDGYWAYAHLNSPAYTDDSMGLSFTDGVNTYKYDVAMVTELIDRAELVAEAKENAELAKAQIAIDGTSAVEIDAALEAAIDDIYKGLKTNATIAGLNTYDTLYHYVEYTLIGGTTVKINGIAYDAIEKWYAAAVDGSTYDDAKVDEVIAIYKDAKAAVRAAESKAAANEAFLTAYAEFDAVITAAEHAKDFNYTTGANYKAYQEAKAELRAYATAKYNYVNALGDASDYADLAKAAPAVAEYYITEIYDECFTAEEMAAMLAEGKAAIDGIKTIKELEAAAKEINAEVAALPTTATVADKEAVMAAYDKVADHNWYCELIESDAYKVSYAKVARLAGIIEDAELKAITDAIKVIDKDKEATLDEKAAVEAVRDALDAYYDYWAEDYAAIYDGAAYATADNAVDGFEADIYDAEIQAVLKMIAKLPADGSDAAAVVAARDAFDALSRYQQHDIQCSSSRYYAYYNKLVDAEKMVAAELQLNVEGLKITAGSTAKKGSITVKWDVKGSTVGVEAYEIWKSTKKNSGFKKAFTTEKMSYKNTKGLKKGTRYYYKVRAIATIDGEKITSDWSNKAYRIAK